MAGNKDVKLPQFSLIPAYPMWEVAKVFGYGARKYEPRNWEQGIPFSSSIDALERHLALYKANQDIDIESGLPHLAHLVFHALTLMQNKHTHPELDDRSNYYTALLMDAEIVRRESRPLGEEVDEPGLPEVCTCHCGGDPQDGGW